MFYNRQAIITGTIAVSRQTIILLLENLRQIAWALDDAEKQLWTQRRAALAHAPNPDLT